MTQAALDAISDCSQRISACRWHHALPTPAERLAATKLLLWRRWCLLLLLLWRRWWLLLLLWLRWLLMLWRLLRLGRLLLLLFGRHVILSIVLRRDLVLWRREHELRPPRRWRSVAWELH